MINFEQELEKAKNGDGTAAYIVGECYLQGYYGVKENINKAIKWRKKGVKMQDNALCLFHLSFTNRENRKKAKKFFDLSFDKIEAMANQGEKCAQCLLGLYHARGYMGNMVDFKKAADLYEKSAMQGYPTAQNNIGYYYFEGKGVELNLAKAIEWFDKAIACGSKESIEMRQLAVDALRKGGVGVSTATQPQQLKELKCSNCGGTIQLQNNINKGFCNFCNTAFVLH